MMIKCSICNLELPDEGRTYCAYVDQDNFKQGKYTLCLDCSLKQRREAWENLPWKKKDKDLGKWQ